MESDMDHQRRTFNSPFYVAAALLVCCVGTAWAQTTAFTYQGKLIDAGNPANGNYDLQFRLFDTPTVGTGAQFGATVVRNPVLADAGIFTVQLDFGATVFGGADRYLEIGVRPANNAGAYTVLAPRQPVTASPYAIQTINSQQLGGLPAARYIATDSNGNVGIGIASTGNKLDVNGQALFRAGGNGGGFFSIHSPNGETGLTINGNGTTRADLRFDGATLKLLASTQGIPPVTNGVVISTGGDVGIGTANVANGQLNVDGFAQNAIYASSNFGYGMDASGTFGGVRGFTSTPGARGVYGISLNGIGVEGSSNGSDHFAVFSNGYLGLDRLGTGGNTTMCRNASNQFATCGSSLRYKMDLQPYGGGLDVVNRLQPLAYRWKSDHSLDVGFGAEMVAEIEPLLVTRNEQGEVEGVKYDHLSVVFVNAFKQQQTQLQAQAQHIVMQQTQIDQQQQQLDGLRKLVCQIQPHGAACEE
jgi:hypothetical protein